MPHSHFKKSNHMAITFLTTNPIHSPNNQDPTPPHSSLPTQPNTKNTPSDLEAALILLQIRAPSIDKPTVAAAAPIPKSSAHAPPSKNRQASKTKSKERQQKLEKAAAYQRRRRAKQPIGHRRAEDRRYLDRETESHREERLRKKREAQKARRSGR